MDLLGHEMRKIAHFLLKLMKQSCYIISQEFLFIEAQYTSLYFELSTYIY